MVDANDSNVSVDDIVKVGESVLSDCFSKHLTLKPLRVWDGIKGTVVRARVQPSLESVPGSVIVKRSKCKSALEDWAASVFLNAQAGDFQLAPNCFGGNAESQTVVLEDLGDGTTTLDLLMGDDPESATQALIEHMGLLGRLHAATRDRADEYEKIRHAFGPRHQPKPLYHDPWSIARREQVPVEELERVFQEYARSLQLLDCTPSHGIAEEIAAVTAAVEGDPGPFLSFCQGDVNTPGSCIRRQTNLWLVDFDSSGIRHAFTEALAGRLMWGCQLRIPERILEQMDDAYRGAFSKAYPPICDDRLYAKTMAEAAARWHIFHVIWRLPTALEGDYQRGLSSLRQQFLGWLDTFAMLTESFDHMSILGNCARRLLQVLHAEWSPKLPQVPYYRVFREAKVITA